MTQIPYFKAIIVFFTVIVLATGCNKERIVESTEYVHDIEYVESPPDTVFHLDTLAIRDSVEVKTTDTIRLIDTVTQTNQIHDTVRITVTVHDTVVRTQYHYDTLVDVDTIIRTQYQASAVLAIEAMQAQTTPLVFDYIAETYGLGEGWVFFLTSSQMNVTQSSTNVYDIYGYLEYYTEDWSEYYPLEFYWRITYNSGDPSNSNNWTMSDPPSTVAMHQPGMKAMTRATPSKLIQ
jgi:hypothetical protein